MSLHTTRTISPVTIALAYAGIMAVGLFLVMSWRYPEGLAPELLRAHWQQFSVVFLLWLVVYFSLGLFELERLRGMRFVFLGLASGAVLNFMAAVLYFYAQPQLLLTPRRFLLALVITVTVLLCVVNVFYLWYLRKFTKRLVASFGSQDFAQQSKELVGAFSHLGFAYTGRESEVTKSWDFLLYSNVQDLPPGELSRLYKIRSQGFVCVPFAAMYEQLWRRVYLPEVREGWLLEVVSILPAAGFRAVKRLIDIAVGFMATLVFLLTYPVIALAIKLDSPGPVFFLQERVGFRGARFVLPKYRTMRHDGPHDLWTASRDPRITRVGKYLRKLRLDELPQAWLVLKGIMSLVGPRPEQSHIVEKLRQEIPFYEERHWAKPGLTGWAQLHVYAATVEESREKLAYDLYYLKHQTAGLDTEIILKTVWRIIFAGGV